ncbi:MAG TPA: NADH-quinone oxidoreductase subunit B [Anaeromyxobacter sp.]|nr:NADH-quinone oxidoreductase subunit B [Anaeromyxobacter sp.]
MVSESEGVPAITTRREQALTGLQALISKGLGWARKYSLFQYPFVTACCGMEYMAIASARYDLDRFGAALPRFSPRQADLLMVVGTVNCKQAPILRRIWEQMADPKWVMAFGVCASSGGFYDNYATVQGIDRIVPVDIYVPGCPPRPEQVLDGIMMLQQKIQDQAHKLIEKRSLPAAPAERRGG